MRTFARLFSIVALLLSIGLVAQALPHEAKSGALVAREEGVPAILGSSNPSNTGVVPCDKATKHTRRATDSMMILSTAKNDIDVLCLKLKSSSSPADANAVIGIIVGKLKACALAGLGATPVPDKAKAAAVLLQIFQAIVAACATVSAKFGAGICADLLAQVDTALSTLLFNLDKNLGGFIPIVAGLCAKLDPSFAANLGALGLKLVAKALGLA